MKPAALKTDESRFDDLPAVRPAPPAHPYADLRPKLVRTHVAWVLRHARDLRDELVKLSKLVDGDATELGTRMVPDAVRLAEFANDLARQVGLRFDEPPRSVHDPLRVGDERWRKRWMKGRRFEEQVP